jgi:hypothetical protein
VTTYLFPSAILTPAGANNDPNVGLSLGQKIQVNAAGLTLTAVRWQAVSTDSALQLQVGIYDAAGTTLLASSSLTSYSVTASAWTTINLPTPLALTNGASYFVMVYQVGVVPGKGVWYSAMTPPWPKSTTQFAIATLGGQYNYATSMGVATGNSGSSGAWFGVDIVAADSSAVTAAFTGTGTLTLGAVPANAVTVALTGTGTLGASGKPAGGATVALGGAGSLSIAAAPGTPGAVALAGAGTLTAGGSSSAAAAVALAGSGTLTAAGSGSSGGTDNVDLSGSGTLTAGGTLRAVGAAALSGLGTLTAGGRALVAAIVQLTGSGLLTAIAKPTTKPRDLHLVAIADPSRWFTVTLPIRFAAEALPPRWRVIPENNMRTMYRRQGFGSLAGGKVRDLTGTDITTSTIKVAFVPASPQPPATTSEDWVTPDVDDVGATTAERIVKHKPPADAVAGRYKLWVWISDNPEDDPLVLDEVIIP